jgi:hypothetical protein
MSAFYSRSRFAKFVIAFTSAISIIFIVALAAVFVATRV